MTKIVHDHSRPRYGLPLEPHKLLAELYLRHRLGCQRTAAALPWDKLHAVPALPWVTGFNPNAVVEPASMWMKLHRKKHGFSLVATRVRELAAALGGSPRVLIWEDVTGIDTGMLGKWQTLTGLTFERVSAETIVEFWRELELSPPVPLDPPVPAHHENPLAELFRSRVALLTGQSPLGVPASPTDVATDDAPGDDAPA